MQLQDLLITEQATVKDAIQQLERLRCKVIYVVKDRKLLASVSDGDVRRYTLQAGNINDSVSQIIRPVPAVNMKKKRGRLYFRIRECIRSLS